MQTSRTVRLRKAQQSKHPELRATHDTNRHETKHRKRNFAPVLSQETKHSIAHVVKTPVCLHPRRPPGLDGTGTSYITGQFQTFTTCADPRMCSRACQYANIAHVSLIDAFDDMSRVTSAAINTERNPDASKQPELCGLQEVGVIPMRLTTNMSFKHKVIAPYC